MSAAQLIFNMQFLRDSTVGKMKGQQMFRLAIAIFKTADFRFVQPF
jgi:hypothetical protein